MKETVLGLNKDMKFYFCPEYVNMQKGIDSLCGFIRSNLMRDPFSNEVFIFMGRNTYSGAYPFTFRQLIRV